MKTKGSDTLIAFLAMVCLALLPIGWLIFWAFHADMTEMRMFINYWPFAVISLLILYISLRVMTDAGRRMNDEKERE